MFCGTVTGGICLYAAQLGSLQAEWIAPWEDGAIRAQWQVSVASKLARVTIMQALAGTLMVILVGVESQLTPWVDDAIGYFTSIACFESVGQERGVAEERHFIRKD